MPMLLERKTMQLADGVLLHIDPSSEYVALEIDGKKDRLIKKVDLWGACFLMADAKTQEALMPVRQTEVVTYRRIHNVRVDKLIKPGQLVKVSCEISVPQVVNEGLAGNLLKKRPERGKILVPGSN